ncbi:hypothetical protein PYW08_007121 [Mythimna loreyi]|uniref:Uncharacterized protein n=1 Tax=Mythimna loreyi TaxID=667449 RepID=A0ACC2R9I4_9NEOP|nr:hypothetical protein PYW08_007121 [Mythimna loreyi]
MRVLGEEQQQLCPCYKEYADFLKLAELEDCGLIIYCHRTRTDNIRQVDSFEPTVSTSRDVFIIHNKKDVKITTSELATELDKNKIKCPRCRKAFEHAQELMQEVKSIERNIIMGICDHCRKKAQTITNRVCACDETVRKFINVIGEQKEYINKYVKIWLSKIGRFKEGKILNKSQQITPRAYSDFKFNRDLKSPASSLKLQVEQMFYSDKHESGLDLNKKISKTDINVHIKQGVAFVQPDESRATSLAHVSQASENLNIVPSPSLVGSDTFVEAHDRVKALPKTSIIHHKQDEILEKVPSADAKDELKRRHDLSLRQMMRREKDSIHKRPDVYETPKMVPWEQKEPVSKYNVESEADVRIPIKIKQDSGLYGIRAQSKRPKYVSSKTAEAGSRDSNLKPRKSEKYSQQKIEKRVYDFEERPKKDKKQEDYFITHKKLRSRSDSHKIKKQSQHGTQSKIRSIESAGTVLTSQYSSFFFSKDKDKKKERNLTKLNVTSSHLITVTKEKFHLQTEKKKQEEERRQKLAQEAKKQKAEEKRRQVIEKQEDLEKKISGESTQFKATKKKKLEVAKSKSTKGTDTKGTHTKGTDTKGTPTKGTEKLSRKKLSREKADISMEGQAAVSMSKIQISISKEQADTSKELTESQAEIIRLKDEHLQEKEAIYRKKHPDLGAKKKVTESSEHKPKEIELEFKQIKMEKELSDHILKLVRIKQAKMVPRDFQLGKPVSREISKPAVVYVPAIEPKIKCHHIENGQDVSVCLLCLKELESETLSSDSKKNLSVDKTDIIIGEKIFQYIPPLEKIEEPEGVTILLHKDFYAESKHELNEIEITPQETITPFGVKSKKDVKEFQFDATSYKGVTRYALSDRAFIDRGWTMLPTEKVVRKMNVYRMRPAHPEFDWFEHNKNKRLMTYDTGERLAVEMAEFDDNGRGRWYYRSGRLALDYYDAKETNARQRVVIYSSGEPDERGRTHPITILATFDYNGNGIVFDHAGKIRLKYNQNEGVVLDRTIGPVSHWQWHSLNDPPVLQQVMIDTQMAHKDPDILKFGSPSEIKNEVANEEMLAIEFDNFIKEKNKKLSQKFKPFQIKMKALKINEYFSLKVLDQATVYLIFRDGLTNLKLNIGMILDHQEIVDTDTAEVGDVSNSLERFPARTDSLAGLQRSVAYAQRYERQHAERERRLRLPEPSASVDLMTAAASPPIRLPLRTVPIGSSISNSFSSRKPANNLYYDSRLLC